MTEDFSAVRLQLDSRPEAPAIVRAALAGAAQAVSLDSELFDDLKTAVSEAVNNAVLHAYDGRRGPLAFALEIRADEVDARVRDWGGGIQHVGPSDERMGVGLAVISALADRAEFISAPDGGTEVRMSFVRRRVADRRLPGAGESEPATGSPVLLSGEVVVTLSPAGLLAGVLGRLTRALAGRTHLSLDRFSDLYLVADAVAALARSEAAAGAISFALTAERKRLELTVGPFRDGTGARFGEEGAVNPPGSALAPVLADFTWEPVEDHELLHVVIEDTSRQGGAPRGSVSPPMS